MGKIIHSPNEHFTGTVELYDPLTYPQVVAYQEAVAEVKKIMEDNGDLSQVKFRSILLPSMLKCVSKWSLKNIPKKPTYNKFPATPLIDAGDLFGWLHAEINELLVAAETVPNE